MKKHIVILNRWTKVTGYTDFGGYIDHDKFQVHYLVLAGNENSINVAAESIASLVALPDFDFKTVQAACAEIVAKYGPMFRLIAMAEKDLLVAAKVRDLLKIPGMGYEFARRFIDKGLMKSFIIAAKIATPNYRDLSAGSAGLRFPLILKPKSESSSRGVVRVESEVELQCHIPISNHEDYLLEEFCPNEVCHLDGFAIDGKIVFLSSSQYVGNCLDHTHGRSLGSVQIVDEKKKAVLEEFADSVLAALDFCSGSFHLECFLDDLKPIFLEIAARAGGGDIREVIELAHGFNIVKAWIDVQLGLQVQVPEQLNKTSCGFLIIPGPSVSKCLSSVSSIATNFSCIAKERIFPVGYQFPGNSDIFLNSAARYIFIGSDAEIRDAIATISAGFQINYSN